MKRYNEDALESDLEDEMNEDKIEKKMANLDKLYDKMEQIVDAFDKEKEVELHTKARLDAKVQVLRDEMSADRTSQAAYWDEEEAYDYAMTIALMRLEAKSLEQQLAKINKKYLVDGPPKAMFDTEQPLNNEAHELLDEASDPVAILDHFGNRSANREGYLQLGEDLESAQILPESLK